MPDTGAHIVVFDIETTGLDVERDQIIEFAARFGLRDDAPVWRRRIRPSIPVPAEATAVHGIRAEDLAGCEGFASYAENIRRILGEAQVLVAYNASYDLAIIRAEYARHGLPEPDLRNASVVDPLQIWRRCEPRNLAGAYRRFVREEPPALHTAEGDIVATSRVLLGMLEAFGLSGRSWEDLVRLQGDRRGRGAAGRTRVDATR